VRVPLKLFPESHFWNWGGETRFRFEWALKVIRTLTSHRRLFEDLIRCAICGGNHHRWKAVESCLWFRLWYSSGQDTRRFWTSEIAESPARWAGGAYQSPVLCHMLLMIIHILGWRTGVGNRNWRIRVRKFGRLKRTACYQKIIFFWIWRDLAAFYEHSTKWGVVDCAEVFESWGRKNVVLLWVDPPLQRSSLERGICYIRHLIWSKRSGPCEQSWNFWQASTIP
jgi:hypothetical protein